MDLLHRPGRRNDARGGTLRASSLAARGSLREASSPQFATLHFSLRIWPPSKEFGLIPNRLRDKDRKWQLGIIMTSSSSAAAQAAVLLPMRSPRPARKS